MSEKKIKTQVVVYTYNSGEIGGIETFVYNFCMNFKDKYDIICLYELGMARKQIHRLIPYVEVIKNNSSYEIECDTLIVNNLFYDVPKNVKAKKTIQMVHAMKQFPDWHIPKENDVVVTVSDRIAKDYGEEVGDNQMTIHNITYPTDTKKALRLISATRLTPEKGKNRMIELANMLNENCIPFVWTVFTNDSLDNMPYGIVKVPPTLNIRNYLKGNDYLVQLSDTEGCPYALLEALELNIPLLVTDLPCNDELGIVDGKNAYVFDMDMKNVDVEKIYTDIPKFEYKSENTEIKKKWVKLLGTKKPKGDYKYKPKKVKLVVLNGYVDSTTGEEMRMGIEFYEDYERAEMLVGKGFCDYMYD